MKYTQITNEFTDKFFKIVESSENIAITAHFSPDGDSISSVLSMYRIISDKYKDKKVKVVYSGKPDERYKYFQNFDTIEWVENISDNINGCDLLIILDCSLYSRFTVSPIAIKNTICIDHHASESDEFTLSTIVPSVPSCSELIFRLFENHLQLDKSLAEIFLLGIISDTGSFTFLDSSKSETFSVAKKLLDVGDINISALKSQYSFMSKREFVLLQEFVSNTSFGEADGWPPFQYTYVRREFTEEGKYTNIEITSASKAYIAGYLGSLEGYSWGFIVRPKSSFCGISMRSLVGGVNVRKILEKMSLGGGHDRAAGGIFENEKDPQKCIESVLTWLKNNKPEFD